MLSKKSSILKLVIIVLVIVGVGGYIVYTRSQNTTSANDTVQPIISYPVSVQTTTSQIEVKEESEKDVTLSADLAYDATTPLPKFVTISNHQMIVKPQKGDAGNYSLTFNSTNSQSIYAITVKPLQIDWNSIDSQIKNYLGSKLSDFAVYVWDENRKEQYSLNGNIVFGPASIIKLPYALLVLRDIDAGKYTLNTTFPVSNKDKFSTLDPIGALPQGTQLPISTYLSNMISISSNTALRHLDTFLGGADIIDKRIINELGVNPYFDVPQISTSETVGSVLKGILEQKYLKKETNDYLINLMRNAAPDLKIGIGNGLPQKPGVTFVNKVGFYDTTNDLAYMDAAIVWGEKTTYVIDIMDRKIDWASAEVKLKDISQIVYNELNK